MANSAAKHRRDQRQRRSLSRTLHRNTDGITGMRAKPQQVQHIDASVSAVGGKALAVEGNNDIAGVKACMLRWACPATPP